jgi:ankyrin repeat protein
LLRLALYPPSRAKPDSDDIVGQTFGHVDAKSKTGQDLSEALFCAKNPEAFEYIQSCLGGSQLQGYGGDILLAKYSELGNVEMVRYLLDAGVPPQTESLNLNSLVIASRFSHDDVVRVLLAHGADPNKWKKQQRGPPLMNAAAAGSMSIARMLIDAGANGSEVSASIMENAVRLEHTAMVELFLDEGICSPKSSARALKRQAKEKGLESMVALLERRGVTSGSSKTQLMLEVR